MTLEAVKNYSVGFQQPYRANLKSQQGFTSAPEVHKEKSNAAKYMIGATVLAGIAALGIAGYKGHLGEGIQKFLGGAEKAAKNGGTNASEGASHSGSSLSKGVDNLEDDPSVVSGMYGQDINEPYVTNGTYGQDVNDLHVIRGMFGQDVCNPADPRNAYDISSPFYNPSNAGSYYGMNGGL